MRTAASRGGEAGDGPTSARPAAGGSVPSPGQGDGGAGGGALLDCGDYLPLDLLPGVLFLCHHVPCQKEGEEVS